MKLSLKKGNIVPLTVLEENLQLVGYYMELEAGESEKMKRHFVSQSSKADLNMEDSFTFSSNVWTIFRWLKPLTYDKHLAY